MKLLKVVMLYSLFLSRVDVLSGGLGMRSAITNAWFAGANVP